jgi:PiT family inorganic phosphate transporter
MTQALILVTVVGLAYANGANDNFKGVATLFGSGTTGYRRALAWATFTTLLGSLTAVLLAGKLLRNFSGRGLVPDALVNDPRYVAAVALGAGLTVLLANRVGLPVSTTHGLVGALVGAGWAAGSSVTVPTLASAFFTPLLLSPLLAITATALLYPMLHRLRLRLGVTEETCFCVGAEPVEVVPLLSPSAALQRAEHLTAAVGTTVICQRRYGGKLLGFQASSALNGLHYLSAGIVSYARGLNDTPKIAALLLLVPHLSGLGSTILVGLVIAAGGLLHARRVAETMSHKITPLNHGQGLTANLLTGVIVIGASRLGLPVSTTHVSCGALFGIGAVTRRAEWGTIAKILVAWVTTLPAGAALGAISFGILGRF